MDKVKGLTQTEYAKLKGITASAVNQQIKKGTIGWNGKSGKECRVWDLQSADDLQSVRKEKIKVDTILQNQKVKENRLEALRVAVEIVDLADREAFRSFSAELKNLHLSADDCKRLSMVLQSGFEKKAKLKEKIIDRFIETGSVEPD